MSERLDTCPSCGVDVSVPPEVAQPRCPRCDGLLEPVKDASAHLDRTVISWRPPRSPDETATWRGAPSSSEGGSEGESGSGPPSAVPVPPPPLAQGSRFGPYVLEGILGKGGMGVVYRAHQQALQRWVALKVLTTPSLEEEDRKRFLNEARAAARLSHPNIVPVHDVGSVDGRDYFTMDLVEGMTLHEATRRRLLQPKDVFEIVRKVALAVDYAHKEGIIHRDLKPGNILLDTRGPNTSVAGDAAAYEPRVTDFGLAKDLAQPLGLTLSGVALGSPPYMPPEQARGTMREVDHLSDVYSLGAVLYEGLTGEPPFTGTSLYEIVARIQTEDPVPPRKRNSQVSVDAETIVLRCLEKEKWRRYPSAGALARDLERLLHGEPIHAMRTGLTTRIARRLERHLHQLTSILLMGSIIVGLVAYMVATSSANARSAAPSAGTPRDPRGDRDAPGPIEEAAKQIARGKDAQALEALVRLLGGDAARWPDVRARAASLAEPARSALEARLARDAPPRGSPDESAPLSGEKLDDLLTDLGEEKALDARALGAAARALLEPHAPGPLAPVAERAVEVALVRRALRAEERSAVLDAASAAFVGSTVQALDLALAGQLVTRLGKFQPADRHGDLVALAGLSPRLAAVVPALDAPALPVRMVSGALERFDAKGRVFRFPPVALASENRGGALLARGAPAWLLEPTLPVRSLDGRRVIVGWLRFLYALDDTGRILARQRLPGRAVSLARHAAGPLVVTCDPSADGLSGPVLRVRSRDLASLEGEDGEPLPPVALDVTATWATVFEMRELARVTSEDATNPWVRADHATSGAEMADALQDPSLTPQERAALACRVFARGFPGEAEEAWQGALSDLVARHGYVPELAGYGEGDVGLELAAARERAPPGEARAELAAWRDAFAPVLADPRRTATFAPTRVAPPPRPGPLHGGGEPPRKGIGGLDGRWFERLSIVLRFQREFVLVALAVGFLASMRWRRQQRRDLAKVGARTARERWLLYGTAPGLRVGFALPTYAGAGDKLAFLFLYVAYLGAFAVQDAALNTCTAIRRAPQAVLVGLPDHPTVGGALPRTGTVAERVRARDALVLGATRWWSQLPRLLAELSLRSDTRSVAEFRAAYPEASANYEADLDFLERVRNRFFWIIPSTIVLFIVALLLPTRRPFEPGPEDLKPALSTRLLSLLVPGAPQFMTGRPVRGVLLLAPFLLVAQTVFNQLVMGKAFLFSVFDPFFTGDVQSLAARLVAESPDSLARIHRENGLALLALLVLLYAIHWTDLGATRRRALRLLARSTRGKAQAVR